jgi:hypothetical protein
MRLERLIVVIDLVQHHLGLVLGIDEDVELLAAGFLARG